MVSRTLWYCNARLENEWHNGKIYCAFKILNLFRQLASDFGNIIGEFFGLEPTKIAPVAETSIASAGACITTAAFAYSVWIDIHIVATDITFVESQ